MNAIRFETTIDETVAAAMPKLRPMLGRRVEVIAVEPAPPKKGKSLDDFLAHRLKRPDEVEPVSLEVIEATIARGALDGDV